MRKFDKEENETFEELEKLGMKIFQRKDGFRFGIDSILIPYFVELEPESKVVEIGTGSGIIAMQLVHRYPKLSMTAVEIQREVAKIARKNIEYNKLENRIELVESDIKSYIPKAKVDAIITNPPYMRIDEGKVSENKIKAVSRHEVELSLEELLSESSRMLKKGGSLNLVYRTVRFNDFMELIYKYDFSVKRLRFVYSKKDGDSILFMVEAVKGKKVKSVISKPLYIYEEDGIYSKEVQSYY